MKIVFPIAGRGSRFQVLAKQNAAYTQPKPLILVKGKPMIAWAVASLKKLNQPSHNFIFITLQEHVDLYHIDDTLQELFGPDIQIIILPQVTRGATQTVLRASEFINNNDDLLIADCDNYFDGTNLERALAEKSAETEGIIPVFKPDDTEPKWSYTLFDKDQTALAVGEKDPDLAAKGAYANIGAYYFSHGKIFVEEAEKMIEENDVYGSDGKKEFYIAPLYQRLINKGMQVKAAIIPKLWGMGTPNDLEYFLENFHEI